MHAVSSNLHTLLLVMQTTHQTAHGQLLDLTTAPPGTTDLSKFTVNNYMRIVTFKTAYYSFYLPVACGMLISGITDASAFQAAKDILLIMGQYFQV
jgi:farnesyl diphosphate synthase